MAVHRGDEVNRTAVRFSIEVPYRLPVLSTYVNTNSAKALTVAAARHTVSTGSDRRYRVSGEGVDLRIRTLRIRPLRARR